MTLLQCIGSFIFSHTSLGTKRTSKSRKVPYKPGPPSTRILLPRTLLRKGWFLRQRWRFVTAPPATPLDAKADLAISRHLRRSTLAWLLSIGNPDLDDAVGCQQDTFRWHQAFASRPQLAGSEPALLLNTSHAPNYLFLLFYIRHTELRFHCTVSQQDWSHLTLFRMCQTGIRPFGVRVMLKDGGNAFFWKFMLEISR